MGVHRLRLAAVGTIRGRVRRRELCLGPVEAELENLLEQDLAGEASTAFERVFLTIHFSESHEVPVVRGLDPQQGLILAVGVPLRPMRNLERDRVCAIVRRSALEALVAGMQAYRLEGPALRRALELAEPRAD